jgi:hypothetical protein
VGARSAPIATDFDPILENVGKVKRLAFDHRLSPTYCALQVDAPYQTVVDWPDLRHRSCLHGAVKSWPAVVAARSCLRCSAQKRMSPATRCASGMVAGDFGSLPWRPARPVTGRSGPGQAGARIFAFIRSPCAYAPQKSWCASTAQSWHAAWATTRHREMPLTCDWCCKA